jgi:DNA-binding response OmpR family regulator
VREGRAILPPSYEPAVREKGAATIPMTGQQILVVDDEPKIVRIVQAYLERDGYGVLTASDGPEALDMLRRERPDLVVLDLMLPAISGWDVCRALRRDAMTATLPIIMLTARDEISDRIVGLELGADDYVVKPFDPNELVARIHAVLRRVRRDAGESAARRLRHGELLIDLDQHEVQHNGERLSLTPTEFQILATLAARPERVFSRQQLLDAVQGEAFEGFERIIDSHVKNLRRKLEADPSRPRHVRTIFGVGYAFYAADSSAPA